MLCEAPLTTEDKCCVLVLIAMSHGSLCIPQGLADMVGLMSDVNRNLQAMEGKSAARVQVGEAWLAFHDQVRRLHSCAARSCVSSLSHPLPKITTFDTPPLE